MSENRPTDQELSLESILARAITLPGVKVDRKQFLAANFASEDCSVQAVLDMGPVDAGCPRELLKKKASALIFERTGVSSIASFVSGLPGGAAMAVSIPADVLQFFGMTLRLAQELVYLYGGQDLWENGEVDSEKVRAQLVMYCGVMFGVSGAAAGVRLLSSQIAKTTLKKLPQKALTKTVWYPIVKQTAKAIGIKVTKSSVAKGISKAVPVIGGIVSGTLNFAAMMPMGNRLAETLDKAAFDYTDEEIFADFEEVSAKAAHEGHEEPAPDTTVNETEAADPVQDAVNGIASGIQHIAGGIAEALNKIKADLIGDDELAEDADEAEFTENFPDDPREDFDEGFEDDFGDAAEDVAVFEKEVPENDIFDMLVKLSKLKDMGVITEEEFAEKKKELLARL